MRRSRYRPAAIGQSVIRSDRATRAGEGWSPARGAVRKSPCHASGPASASDRQHSAVRGAVAAPPHNRRGRCDRITIVARACPVQREPGRRASGSCGLHWRSGCPNRSDGGGNERCVGPGSAMANARATQLQRGMGRQPACVPLSTPHARGLDEPWGKPVFTIGINDAACAKSDHRPKQPVLSAPASNRVKHRLAGRVVIFRIPSATPARSMSGRAIRPLRSPSQFAQSVCPVSLPGRSRSGGCADRTDRPSPAARYRQRLRSGGSCRRECPRSSASGGSPRRVRQRATSC